MLTLRYVLKPGTLLGQGHADLSQSRSIMGIANEACINTFKGVRISYS